MDNVEVTPANAANVLAGKGKGKDGCVAYDFAKHTLTLKDAKLTNRITVTAERPDQPITIRLEGKNEINTISAAIWVLTPVIVEGPGELHINTTKGGAYGCGFWLSGEQPELYLKIKDTKVRIESADKGQAIFSTVMREGFVVLENADFRSTGLIASMKELYLQGCHIVNSDEVELGSETRPNGVSCAVMLIKGTTEYNYGVVEIAPDNSFPIMIGATAITKDNVQDVLAKEGKSGAVHYDRATNTLYLKDLKLEEQEENGILTRFSPLDKALTISVEGNNVIESNYSGLLLFGNTTIKGTGSLTINAQDNTQDYAGIFIADEDKLTIEDCELMISGSFAVAGIRNNSKLEVRNAALSLRCLNPERGACIEGFSSLQLEKSLFVEPQGAHFNRNLRGVTVDDHTLCKGEVKVCRANALESVSRAIPSLAISQGKISVTLATPEAQWVALYSLEGQLLRCQLCHNSLEWSFPSGQYLLKIGGYTTKVLIP